MPGAPVSSWMTLLFLLGVLVLMALDYPVGSLTVAALPLIGLGLLVGWALARKKVMALRPGSPMAEDEPLVPQPEGLSESRIAPAA